MRRNIYHRHVNDDEIEEDGNHPGCMWGFIHVLDWNHNVKKILRHHKYQETSQAKGKVNSRTSLTLEGTDESQKLLKDNGRSHLLVNRNTKSKKSIKARIKALMAEEFSKHENGEKQKKPGYSPRRQLQRTCSIHYLKSPDCGLNRMRTNEDDGNESLSSQEMKFSNKPDPSIIGNMTNADEDSFGEVGNGDDSSGEIFRDLSNSRTKARLTKSGTFPNTDSFRRMNLKPAKLEHKKNEIWFSPQGEKLVDYAQVQDLALPKYKMKFRARSWSLDYDNEFIMRDRKSSPASEKSNTELKKQRENEMVVPVEKRNQRVEPVAIEDKSEGRIDETESRSFHELNDYSLSKTAVIDKRGSSFNDSLDRYARLLEYSTRQEIILHPWKSLKLRNEYDPLSGGNISFRKIRSLSHLDFCYPIENTDGDTQDEEFSEADFAITDEKETVGVSNDETVNEMVERTDTIGSTESLRVNMKNEVSAELLDVTEKFEETDDKNTPSEEEDIKNTERNVEELSQPLLDSNSGATLLGESSPTYSSEGSENSCKHDEESDIYSDLQETDGGNSLSTRIPHLESYEYANENFKTLDSSESYKKDDPDLLYVREILEQSGLNRDVFNGASLLAEQPLDTSEFEKLEAYWHQELECSEEDTYNYSHHRLLYDLIIEVITQIYDRSYTMYPKALSTSCHIRPLPSLNRFLDEVYASISKLLSRTPYRFQTLDNIVSRDFVGVDGWVNLQSASECVGLELEDIIFDELLEELLCP